MYTNTSFTLYLIFLLFCLLCIIPKIRPKTIKLDLGAVKKTFLLQEVYQWISRIFSHISCKTHASHVCRVWWPVTQVTIWWKLIHAIVCLKSMVTLWRPVTSVIQRFPTLDLELITPKSYLYNHPNFSCSFNLFIFLLI